MKKLFSLILLCTAALLVLPFAVLAQGPDPSAPVDVSAALFGSLAVLAGAIVPATGYLTALLKVGQGKQLTSWVVALLLGFGAYYFKLGIFASFGPATTALYSFAAGLIANGLADIGWVQGALEAIKARIPTDR